MDDSLYGSLRISIVGSIMQFDTYAWIVSFGVCDTFLLIDSFHLHDTVATSELAR